MTSYILTPDTIARARSRLHERRDALIERHRQELTALDIEIATEVAKLDYVERTVVEMTAAGLVEPTPAPPRRPRSQNPTPTRVSPRYTPEEEAQLAVAVHDDLRQLALSMGRNFGAVERRWEILRKERSVSALETAEPPKRVVPSRPVPSGKPWAPEEDDRLMVADQSGLEQLAQERNTTLEAIKKRRDRVRARRGTQTSPSNAVAPEELPHAPAVNYGAHDVKPSPDVEVPLGSENTQVPGSTSEPPRDMATEPYISDATGLPTSADGTPPNPLYDATIWKRRALPPPQRPPGKPVYGIIDSGREHQRIYDHAFRTRSDE